MQTEFPEILKLEKKREIILTLLFLGIILFPLIFGTIFQSIVVGLSFFVLCVLAAWFVYKEVSLKVVNHCPLCNGGVLAENYANCHRGSSKNIQHVCTSCNNEFVDGILQ